jgi:hypothetical protein
MGTKRPARPQNALNSNQQVPLGVRYAEVLQLRRMIAQHIISHLTRTTPVADRDGRLASRQIRPLKRIAH